MPQPRTKSRKPKTPKAPAVSANGAVAAGEVFNLAEAAAYLRFTEVEVLQMVHDQALPGRQVGREWRFLKSAIQKWLKTPPKRGSREAVLSTIGAWKDDPLVEEELKEIYRRRGRPMTEDEE